MKTLDNRSHDPLPRLAPRAANSHKGDYGRALLIGGCRDMPGAISLAGRATLRSGAGLVTLAVPSCVQDVVAAFEPSYMTCGLPDNRGQFAETAIDEILSLAEQATVVALGPGLGRSDTLTKLVARLYRQIEKPLVVDADGLFALSETPGILSEPGGVRVLTPHPGEFARLTGEQPSENERTAAAAKLAATDVSGQTIGVLKGYRTVISDGPCFSVNTTGNPGMATGGSGDVLTGVITGLLCQGLSPLDAVRLAVHVHGLAGDLAVKTIGEVSMTAGDLIDYLPMAFQSLDRQ